MALDVPALLLQLAVLVAGAAASRSILQRLGQPSIIGDLLFGFLVGPSILGAFAPGLRGALFTPGSAPVLEALAWLGLALFMYTVGAEMVWRSSERSATLFVALGGLAVPVTIGALLAFARPDWFFPAAPGLREVALLCTIIAVSALPVLARILQDVDLLRHRLGSIVIGAGTLDDAMAWIILALAVGGAHVGLSGHLGINIAILAVLAALAFALDGPVMRHVRRRLDSARATLFAALVAAILGSAFLTHEAGLHMVLGPLAVGALLSRHPPLRDYAQARLGGITQVLLLPAFFVTSVADVDLRGVFGLGGLAALGLVLAAASGAKLLGVYLGARAARMTHDAAFVAGILLNARGAVGLVVARVGLEAGILSTSGYDLLVVVIVLTTVLAPPVLRAYVRRLDQARPRPRPR